MGDFRIWRTTDFREDPLIVNEAIARVRIADCHISGLSTFCAGHPQGTRPISEVAQPIKIERLRLAFRITQTLYC